LMTRGAWNLFHNVLANDGEIIENWIFFTKHYREIWVLSWYSWKVLNESDLMKAIWKF
jgi:hypothetical protein